MTTEHTAGPWKIHDNIGRKGELGVIADAAPCIIATMGNAKEWPAEAQANAHLIAASPDLLQALEAMFNLASESKYDFPPKPIGEWATGGHENEAWLQARAAIAKAKGGAQ